MDLRYKFELDVRINELAARRRMLDRQLQVRSVTMAELDNVKAESMKRLCSAVEFQNEQARARNAALREQFYLQTPVEKISARQATEKSKDQLQLAKEEYLRHVENMLPIWHRNQSVQLEESLRAIQLEKVLSQKRREQLQTELARENQIKQQVERHRQELLFSLAAEQRIVLESQANAILLEEESKVINEHLAQQISLSTQEVHGLVASNIQRMRHDIQETYYPPPIIPSYTRRAVDHPREQTFPVNQEQHEEVIQTEFLQRRMENPPLPIYRSGHGTLVIPSDINIDHNTEQSPLETERNLSIMTPTAASAYYPRSRSSSLSNNYQVVGATVAQQRNHFSRTGVLSQQQPTQAVHTTHAAATGESTMLNVRTADRAVLPSVNTSATHLTPAVPADSSFSAHQKLFGDVDLHIQVPAAGGGLISGAGSSVEGNVPPTLDNSLSYSGSRLNSPKNNTSNISMLSNFAFETDAAAAQLLQQQSQPGGIAHQDSASVARADSTDAAEYKPGQLETASVGADATDGGGEVPRELRVDNVSSSSPRSSKLVADAVSSPRSKFAVPIEVKASVSPRSPQQQQGQQSFFSGEDSGAAISRLNSSTLSDNASFKSGGENISVLVERLSLPQCTALLQVIAASIEKRATEGAAPVSASTIYDTQSRHRAVHIIDAFLSGEGVEDVKLSAVLNNAADSTLGNAVLAIVEGKSSVLIPSDAFTGVMTMDKLKKEYKRAGPPGIQALWDKLVAHLQVLVAFRANCLNFLSLCFTSALTAHVEEEDKSRLARKVSNLLQLALIPPETKERSSPSPPYRGRPQSSVLDSPAARHTGTTGFSTTSASPDSIKGGTKPAQQSFNSFNANSAVKKGSASVGASAALYGKASAALKVTRHASEFDDDEIVDDETIERPPPLKDLDMSANAAGAGAGLNPSDVTVHSQFSQLTHSSNSDNTSYDERPVRTAGAGNNNNTSSRNVYSSSSNNNNNSAADDEFDF